MSDDGNGLPKMKWNTLGAWPGLPQESFWTPGNVIAGCIALLYVVVTSVFAGPPTVLVVVLRMVVPLLCIWAPDVMSRYTGSAFYSVRITHASPPGIVSVLGWLLLLLPLVQVMIVAWGMR
jgi:hypothetical protein